ncbi:uncharacterized protein LOC144622689 [Crassostrea virginica]
MFMFEMKEIIILYHLLVLTNSKLYSSPEGLVCCSGFKWDKIENRCIPTFFRPCSDGYYGLKCRLHCPFPDSEEGCVLQCKCSKEIHGCTTLQELKADTTLRLSYRYSPLNLSDLPTFTLTESIGKFVSLSYC